MDTFRNKIPDPGGDPLKLGLTFSRADQLPAM
jgi:hypothetical protein